jgi:hypothetical protein
MSDKWQYYPCTMGEEAASIFFDEGVRDQINAKAPALLARLQLHYNKVRDNGLPAAEEFEPANNAEDDLNKHTDDANEWYVGRITVGRCRYFYVYTSRSEDSWEEYANQLSKRSGYKIEVMFRDDPEHEAYWDELYPSEDDWQVIKDLRVIENLRDHGDDGSASRDVDHWLYFPNEEESIPFISWAVGERYTHDLKNSGPRDDGQYCVRLSHNGTIKLADITHHTIALRRKASELGGDYDGWETPILGTKPNKD